MLLSDLCVLMDVLQKLSATSIGRRGFLITGTAAAASLMCPRWLEADPVYDLAIIGGRIVDPRNCVDGVGDLVVHEGTVVAVEGTGYRARRVVDASGMVVAPGFVDMLADNAHRPERSYRIFEKYKLSDGVTTALQLHGGVTNAKTYRDTMGARAHLINHGVSVKVMRIRKKTRSVEKRLAMVRRTLEEGSLAISHSVEYQPTPFEELLKYGELAREWDVPFFLHLRYSSFERELDGVREALEIGNRTGCRIHMDHLHSTGASWHMEEAIEMVETAIGKGQSVTACVYPYTFWATYLHSKRFGPGWRERYNLACSDLRLVGTAEHLTRRRLRELRKKTWALVAVPEGTMDMEETILPALRRPWVAIASDGGIEREPNANNHPRGSGCFATAVRLGIDRGLGLSETIAKMTSLPSSILSSNSKGMERRGGLGVGDIADVVVFDPGRIRGRSTVEKPARFSDGIMQVVVNGEIVFEGGKILREDAGILVQGNGVPEEEIRGISSLGSVGSYSGGT